MVDGAVAAMLRNGDTAMIRLYVAACSERMAPLFIGLRAGTAGREADVDFYVESVRDLWFADQSLTDAADRMRLLERFPELEPNEEGITDVADTYAFFAVLTLRYAFVANSTGDAGAAMSCGHASLTAMGMLDQNVMGTGFLDQEQHLQALSVSNDVGTLWDMSVAAGQERFRAVLSRTTRRTY
ncbi:hypothetical protein [Streptomyces sp900116325]|uniref:hypothetical protein n=1 Tax=Streptomyces sp. 900116325 TaxID=3154295 RepID=UPI003317BCF7